jgi:hypothetical protein
MYTYSKVLLGLIAVFAISSASLVYEIQYKDGSQRLSEATVQNLVGTALNTEINSNPYLKAIVNVYPSPDAAANYFVVFLQRSDMYLVKCYKISLENLKVSTVVEDYVGAEDEAEAKEPCGACPNPNVQGIMSWILDFQTAISNGRKCIQAMRDAGIVADSLPGSKESLTNIKAYLTCPKLKIWVRIGHGNKSLVQLGAGQSITSSTVTSMKADIKNKIFIFNSCLCFNSPFEPAMKSAQAYFFASGKISLSTGKEQVTTFFVNHALKNKEELDKSMEAAVKEANYANAWGWAGYVNKPWLFDQGTSVSTPSQFSRNSCFEQGYLSKRRQ